MAFPELFPATVPMNRPILPPPVTVQDVEEAKREQAIAPIKGVAVALASAPATGFIPGGVLSLVGAKVQTFGLSGLSFKPTLEGKHVGPTLGPKAFLTYLAPAPIGIVPPELFQLSPSFLHEAIGGDFPGQATIGAKASDVRQRVFLSEKAELAIIGVVLKDYTYPGTPRNLNAIPTVELEAMRNFLRATATTQARSPAALNALNAELLQRGNDALPAASEQPSAIPSPQAAASPVGGPVLKGSTQPQLFKPVSALALAVLASAKWLAKELATERADP